MTDMLNKDLISRCCWQALILAVLAILAFPEAFSDSYWLGQTWLWFTATPSCMLLVLYRHRFAAAWSTALVYSPSRRRRPGLQTQARRKGFGRAGMRQSPVRAA